MPLSFCCIGHALLRPGLLKYIVNPTITYSTVIATANTLILCRLIVPRLSFCLSPSLIIRHGLTGAIFRIIGMRSQRRNGDLSSRYEGASRRGLREAVPRRRRGTAQCCAIRPDRAAGARAGPKGLRGRGQRRALPPPRAIHRL